MNLLNSLTLIFSIIWIGRGFLLNGNQPQNQTSSVYNQYLTIDDKVKIERELEDQHRIIEQQHQDIEKQHQDLVQLKDEQAKTMNILTSQLKEKLTELETKIQSSATNSSTCDHIKSINNELQTKMSLLENKTMELETLREKETKTIEELHHKTIYLKNKVDLLENTTQDLKDLKGVQDLQNLKSVETTLQTLELKVTTLASREQARSDDFLALHNMTENLRHAVYDKNTVFIQARSGISKYYNPGEVVKFTEFQTAIGFPNKDAFVSSGRFNCTYSGLYLVSVTMMSSTSMAGLFIYKNDLFLNELFIGTLTSNYREISGTFLIELQTGDMSYIKNGGGKQFVHNYSMMSIAKIQ